MLVKTHLPKPLIIVLIINTVILFCSSLLRHLTFHSSLDLTTFDQAVYLISQGETPISTILNAHILADHVALIFYPIALLYKIYPSVLWLLLIQAIAFSLGGLAIFYLSEEKLGQDKSLYLVIIYFLYPLIFNANLCDFRPDVIAETAILLTIYFARLKNKLGFGLSLLVILSCKAIIALTVISMGYVILIQEKRKTYGFVAMTMGVVWFLLTQKVIIPYYSHGIIDVTRHFNNRYSYLGHSFLEAIYRVSSNPLIIFKAVLTIDNLLYLIFLFLPIIYIFRSQKYWHHFGYLWGVIPALGMNLLSESFNQKNLVFYYSLPILPFLFLTLIDYLSKSQLSMKQYKIMLIWAIFCFLALGKYGYFWSSYLKNSDYWTANYKAISQVITQESVLTTNRLSAHLAHRSMVKLANNSLKMDSIDSFHYIFLNSAYPDYTSSLEIVNSILTTVKNSPNFVLTYQEKSLYLFTRQNR